MSETAVAPQPNAIENSSLQNIQETGVQRMSRMLGESTDAAKRIGLELEESRKDRTHPDLVRLDQALKRSHQRAQKPFSATGLEGPLTPTEKFGAVGIVQRNEASKQEIPSPTPLTEINRRWDLNGKTKAFATRLLADYQREEAKLHHADNQVVQPSTAEAATVSMDMAPAIENNDRTIASTMEAQSKSPENEKRINGLRKMFRRNVARVVLAAATFAGGLGLGHVTQESMSPNVVGASSLAPQVEQTPTMQDSQGNELKFTVPTMSFHPTSATMGSEPVSSHDVVAPAIATSEPIAPTEITNTLHPVEKTVRTDASALSQEAALIRKQGFLSKWLGGSLFQKPVIDPEQGGPLGNSPKVATDITAPASASENTVKPETKDTISQPISTESTSNDLPSKPSEESVITKLLGEGEVVIVADTEGNSFEGAEKIAFEKAGLTEKWSGQFGRVAHLVDYFANINNPQRNLSLVYNNDTYKFEDLLNEKQRQVVLKALILPTENDYIAVVREAIAVGTKNK